MTKIDLSSYNLSELKELQYGIGQEIKNRQQGDLAKARQQILSIAQDVGVTVEELLAVNSKKSSKGKGKGQKVEPQYHNPAEKGQTWSGRGRQPKWIAEGIAGGKQLADFRI